MNLASIIAQLEKTYPDLRFLSDTTFYWSPQDNAVHYDKNDVRTQAQWALLHEAGHALLKHTKYYSDIELVQMELEAWERAQILAEGFEITINQDHIEDCLDSYRDWLYKRSLCPDCTLCGAQTDQQTYMCLFCHKAWRVSTDRFCRPYRKTI